MSNLLDTDWAINYLNRVPANGNAAWMNYVQKGISHQHRVCSGTI